MPTTSRTNFNEERIRELNPLRWKLVNLPNLLIYYLYFEEYTILIKPKVLEVRLREILTEDVNEAYLESFSKVIQIFQDLNNIGLEGESITLDKGHFARAESVLSGILSKIDDKFSLDLGNGKKFWIDNSLGKLEDETNDPLVREKLDQNLKEMMTSEHTFKDIDKTIKAIGMLAQLRIIDDLSFLNNNKPLENKTLMDYVG